MSFDTPLFLRVGSLIVCSSRKRNIQVAFHPKVWTSRDDKKSIKKKNLPLRNSLGSYPCVGLIISIFFPIMYPHSVYSLSLYRFGFWGNEMSNDVRHPSNRLAYPWHKRVTYMCRICNNCLCVITANVNMLFCLKMLEYFSSKSSRTI